MTSVQLGLTDGDVTKAEVGAVVIAVAKGADGPELVAGAEDVDAAFDGGLAALLEVLGATGRADEITKVPTRGAITAPLLVATGVGTIDGSPDAEQIRRAAGAAARALAGTESAVTTLSRVDLRAAAEGGAIGAYAFSEYRSKAGDPPLAKLDLAVESVTADAERERNRASLVGEAVHNARNLVNTPPNDLFPASFADRAKALGEAAGLSVEVLDEKALADGGYGGVLGVGGGSSRPPRLVQLRHSPAGATKTVSIVGKGVTFDTGGISIKPAANMDQMTSDMAGAAGVVATVVLAAKLELPIQVIATVPMVENMPSGTAYRPGDVLTMYGGKTVEVLNTDAEGRLILADALVRAAEDEPDYLIDTATLTGAQLVALGPRTPGVMGTPEFRDRVAVLSQDAGEGAWPMPLPDHLRADLDSRLADIANVAGHRWGGMLSAAIFLSEFVDDEQQWVHLDIAGPAFNTGSPWGYNGKGATGVPVRTLTAVLEDIAANG